MYKEKILEILKTDSEPFHFFRLFDKVKNRDTKISDYKKVLKELKAENQISITKKDFISLYTTVKSKNSEKIVNSNKEKDKNLKNQEPLKLNEHYYGKTYIHNGIYFVKVAGMKRLFNINSNNFELFEGSVVKIKTLTDLCKVDSIFYECEIIEFVGDGNVPQYETMIAIHNHKIPNKFSEEVENELTLIEKDVTEKERSVRVNLTGLNFITIDGDDSRDFDDAVYCEKNGTGFTLYVAIADVSHYVRPQTVLDKEAVERATSVYFPNQVVPMLPFLLSNSLCSLNPNEERYALTVKIEISKSGVLKDFEFMNSIINSKARMTYNIVGEMLEDKNKEVIEKYKHIYENILNLHGVYEVLRVSRELRGALDFDKKENKITFNEDNSIKDVSFYERNVSHKVIEECMLAANVCAAKLLEKKKIPSLFRVHEEPKDSKLNSLKEFLNSLGLGFKGEKGKEPVKTMAYKKLLELSSKRPDFDLIQLTVLRSMAQAKYQPDNNGHFGLAYESYTHFTSPIRRYPDLLVHRAIKSLILDSEQHEHIVKPEVYTAVPRERFYPYTMADMTSLGEHCSMAERRADDASRDVYDALKCHFLKDHVNESFEGRVAFLTNSAMYIELSKYLMEGVIYYADLEEYYVYIPEKSMIKGKKNKKVYKLGDIVNVKIVKINHENKKVVLDFID
jgi:ribonuclease R